MTISDLLFMVGVLTMHRGSGQSLAVSNLGCHHIDMALPPGIRQAPTPQELEYITGEIIVAIEPLFRMEKVRLVSVSASHFYPSQWLQRLLISTDCVGSLWAI